MGFFPDLKNWRVVRYIKKSDPVEGGLNGAANKPLEDLTHRTGYLKEIQNELITDLKDSQNPVLKQSDLSSSVTSDSEDKAATSSAVKKLNDKVSAIIVEKSLTTEDLFSLNIGFYHQRSNINCTVDRNYPIDRAGSIFVVPSAYGKQIFYHPFDRAYYFKTNKNSLGGWFPWEKIGDIQESIEQLNNHKKEIANVVTKRLTFNGSKTLKNLPLFTLKKGKWLLHATISRNAFAGTDDLDDVFFTPIATNKNGDANAWLGEGKEKRASASAQFIIDVTNSSEAIKYNLTTDGNRQFTGVVNIVATKLS